jgi:glutathione reductase (NADPH)
LTSEQFLELENLADRILFIGGGYISFEFAHIATRAGVRATILHRGERPLDRFEPDLVSRLVAKTRELGVEVHLRAEVKRIIAGSAGFAVYALRGNGAGVQGRAGGARRRACARNR